MFYTAPRTPTHSAFTEYLSNPLRLITTAYETAGLTPPDFGDEQAKELRKEATAEAAAEQYALALYEGGNPKALDQAVKAIQRAQAADYLKEHTPRLLSRVQQDHADQVQATAIEAVTPRFMEVVAHLRDNAQQLPATDPLDKQAAFNHDLNQQWRTTTAALQQLGAFAVVGVTELYEQNAGIGRLLPIVHIPDVTRAKAYVGDNGQTTLHPNQPGQAERDHIATLAADALTGLDRALINVALGKYGEHIKFALADTTELARRVTAATTANTPQFTPAPINKDGHLAGRTDTGTVLVDPTGSRWMNP